MADEECCHVGDTHTGYTHEKDSESEQVTCSIISDFSTATINPNLDPAGYCIFTVVPFV